ncbi:MAG: CAP domain-containing protein [Patescibacteria group bacterium]|nr:CAP domain-containing protein [Patescibacteria group bacterium]
MKKRKVSIRKRARTRIPPLLPRGRRALRRVEFLGATALTVFVLLSAGIFFASGAQRYALRFPNIAAVISAVLVQLSNADRAQNGLGELTVNPVLVAAAQAKANDMAEKGYFAHVSPEGLDPWFWFKQVGYRFEYAGENLAVDFSDSGDVNAAWMNSPTHRDNILDPHYTEVGIATAQGMYKGRTTTFVVQVFGKPSAASEERRLSASIIPEKPTEVATATTRPSPPEAEVLGSSADEASVETKVATTSPALAASLAEKTSKDIPWWGYVVGFPRTTAHIAFYIIAFFVMAALALDTGLEMHWHHRKRALRAGLALAVVSVFFILADFLFFAPPVLALISASL